jgi:hypothetical protein
MNGHGGGYGGAKRLQLSEVPSQGRRGHAAPRMITRQVAEGKAVVSSQSGYAIGGVAEGASWVGVL